MMNLAFRLGTAQDRPAIEAILAESGAAAQWVPEEFLVVECEERLTGFLVTREVAPSEHEILNLAVAKDFRRRGMATAIVRHAMDRSPGDYFLEVRESNHEARALYRKLGFEQTGVRPKYYSDPEEHAIVMRKRS